MYLNIFILHSLPCCKAGAMPRPSPWMIVDGVGRLLDLKFGRLSPRGVGEGEEEGVGRTGKLASLESAAP